MKEENEYTYKPFSAIVYKVPDDDTMRRHVFEQLYTGMYWFDTLEEAKEFAKKRAEKYPEETICVTQFTPKKIKK